MKKGKITDQFVKLEIYKLVNIAKWKAPIVSVFKGYDSTKICGDYKQKVVNQVANCDKCPVPKSEGIFTALYGDNKFSKLDLSHAKQQLLLSPDSIELLTVNNDKELFQPTRLQSGPHSASGILRRELERLIKIRSDDILIFDDILNG